MKWPGLANLTLKVPWNDEVMDYTVHGILHGSSPGFPLAFPAGRPFPNKLSCFVSTCVSLDKSFPSVRKSPLPVAGRRPPASWHICSAMDGPGDHPKWSKSDRERQGSSHHLHGESNKTSINELLYKTGTDSQMQRTKPQLSAGEGWRGGVDWQFLNLHIAIFKMHNQQGPTI